MLPWEKLPPPRLVLYVLLGIGLGVAALRSTAFTTGSRGRQYFFFVLRGYIAAHLVRGERLLPTHTYCYNAETIALKPNALAA
jgi:hypothetical protein